jgi:hypothetical protein
MIEYMVLLLASPASSHGSPPIPPPSNCGQKAVKDTINT